MKQVIVDAFGGPEQLNVREFPTPEPGPGEARVRLTSIGLNHAEIMARRGEYKLTSGEPPFTPGLEGGGIVDAVGPGVDESWVGQRVILSADAPRLGDGVTGQRGTYRTHYITTPDKLLPAPGNLPEEELGTLWLPYLTAWACLIWKQKLQPGQFVGIPAASSSLGIASAQIVRHFGGIPIGMTTSANKAAALKELPEAQFEEVVVTHEASGQMRAWHKELQRLSDGRGIDVFFDPVGAGEYLNREIRALAQHGTIWIYGMLGEPGTVDVSPLIRKHAAIRGWVNGELLTEVGDVAAEGYREILDGVAHGRYRMHIGGRYRLDEVSRAHAEMEAGRHIGKLVLLP